MNYDYINPDHYKQLPKESIEIMEYTFGIDATITFCQMNAFKYRLRLGNKPDQPVDRELDKIKWYENKAKELIKKKAND